MTEFNVIKARSKKSTGFSLLELMIVVVIIGIVAAYGYSVYTENVIQTRRTDAKEALGRLATLQEKFFTECNRYATTLDTTAALSTCAGLNIPWRDGANNLTADGHYAVSIVLQTAANEGPAGNCNAAIGNCFLIQADPVGAGASGLQTRNGVSDGVLVLDHAGRKSWDKGLAGMMSAQSTGMFVDGAGVNIKWSAK